MKTGHGDLTLHTGAFDCEQSVRRLWDYLDGELDAIELAIVDAHLAECDACPKHFAFERRFLDVVRAARVDAGTDDVTPIQGLRGRVVTMLMAAGELVHPETES